MTANTCCRPLLFYFLPFISFASFVFPRFYCLITCDCRYRGQRGIRFEAIDKNHEAKFLYTIHAGAFRERGCVTRRLAVYLFRTSVYFGKRRFRRRSCTLGSIYGMLHRRVRVKDNSHRVRVRDASLKMHRPHSPRGLMKFSPLDERGATVHAEGSGNYCARNALHGSCNNTISTIT